VKVEASKFTEVGYVGRDVESMIRDLVETSVNLVRAEREEDLEEQAVAASEERLLDLLFPAPKPEIRRRSPRVPGAFPATPAEEPGETSVFIAGPSGVQPPGATDTAWGADDGGADEESADQGERRNRTREKLRTLLRDGKLEERMVEVEVQHAPSLEGMMIPMGVDGVDHNFTEMLQDMLPKRTKKRSVRVSEARRILIQEELDRLIDMDEVVNEALDRAEETGIVFLDEIDKVTGERGGAGPDVSREGVQRDLLPVVEGSNVQTKYGLVRTDHILFIAAGAFHVSKPSDLLPELQGRFPIRVELQPLEEKDFVRILTEPRNALIQQYTALVEAEGAKLRFTDDGVREVARIAFELNERMENIGARRLQTVMTSLLESVLFELPDAAAETDVVVDREYVLRTLASLVQDEDLRRYIL
jgi:ATP-dependent HslUV protease ATP-binding subunit HslU